MQTEKGTSITITCGQVQQRSFLENIIRPVFWIIGLLLIFSAIPAYADFPHMVPSSDGNLISYEIYGHGEPSLIFVHGWSCDSRYWRAQVPVFSAKYQEVLMDLAGHGHSGMARSDYTMQSFGEDVAAVVRAIGSNRVITVNGDLWPVNYEANRRHMRSFDAIVLKGRDHFLMMDRPDEFNRALGEAIARLVKPLQSVKAD